jgi:subtilisin-like proprotein convertase family protein
VSLVSPKYGALSFTLNSTNPNGNWHLYVDDDSAGDGGQLASGWSLEIKARVRR